MLSCGPPLSNKSSDTFGLIDGIYFAAISLILRRAKAVVDLAEEAG